MIKKNVYVSVLVFSFCLTTILGCSSGVKMADIATTANPSEEISKLETDLKGAANENVDVLAKEDFQQSQAYLKQAKSFIENEKSQSKVLDALRTSRGYLIRASELAKTREGKAEGLLAARSMAVTAGAATHSQLQDELKDLDADVSDEAATLSETSSDKIAKLQLRYVDLEKRTVILNQLGKAQAMVNGANKSDAEDKAPISYKKAELSLKTAESMISTNVCNPSGYQTAVTKANKDAVQLLKVMTVIDQNGKNLKESVAIKMVAQDKTIIGLSSDLDMASAQGVADQTKLQNQGQALSSANRKVRIQKVLEKARTQFSASEAEAYQQGQNLVVRLKQVNFATGSADLPPNALPLLAKVSEVAKSVGAAQIVVEGHTDSVGGPSENQKISEKRADAVATYFKNNGFENIEIKSEGYGFKKPLATNKSQTGRAQNRRVDVIITPKAM